MFIILFIWFFSGPHRLCSPYVRGFIFRPVTMMAFIREDCSNSTTWFSSNITLLCFSVFRSIRTLTSSTKLHIDLCCSLTAETSSVKLWHRSTSIYDKRLSYPQSSGSAVLGSGRGPASLDVGGKAGPGLSARVCVQYLLTVRSSPHIVCHSHSQLGPVAQPPTFLFSLPC